MPARDHYRNGVPNWVETRDDQMRARTRNNNLDKMKIWRSYDYPHMVMLYYHMYEIASRYPSGQTGESITCSPRTTPASTIRTA